MLTNKSKEDHFKVLDLKTVLSDICGQSLICELILALLSLWLLVNSFKKTFKEKRPIDFFNYFIQIYFYYFSKIFHYFIIFKDILIILLLFFLHILIILLLFFFFFI